MRIFGSDDCVHDSRRPVPRLQQLTAAAGLQAQPGRKAGDAEGGKGEGEVQHTDDHRLTEGDCDLGPDPARNVRDRVSFYISSTENTSLCRTQI